MRRYVNKERALKHYRGVLAELRKDPQVRLAHYTRMLEEARAYNKEEHR